MAMAHSVASTRAGTRVPARSSSHAAPLAVSRARIAQASQPSGRREQMDVAARGLWPGSWGQSQSSMASVSDESNADSTSLPWYKKPCLWKDVESVQELDSILNADGKMAVVEFYAGWCSSCKAAFPGICRIPGQKTFGQEYNFYKMNIEKDDIKEFIKKHEVRGIPHAIVFDSNGQRLLGMGASFKKIDALKKNLEVISETKKKGGKMDFVLDANNLAQPR